MVQWINVLQNSIFVYSLIAVTFLCEKTGAIILAQLALRYSGRQAGRLADEMLLHLEIFKIIYQTKYWKFISVQKGTV